MKLDFTIDKRTRNLSFLRTAVDLKNLGIKNCLFFLRLNDKSLRGVDPYSPFLTEEQKMRISTECVVNPWYFLREVARIPEQGGPGIPYQLNRANLAATWCFINGIDHYLVIPRQIGKTQSTLAILLWAFIFGTTTSEFMFLNKTQEDANTNLERLKDQRALLPSYLQCKIAFSEDGKILEGKDNVKTLTNVVTNNKIVTKAKATSIESAEKIGRGKIMPQYTVMYIYKSLLIAGSPLYS